MNSKASFLQDKDSAVTMLENQVVSSWWQRPIYYGSAFTTDISTPTVLFAGSGLAIVDPTSPLITIFPQKAPTLPLDIWVEVDVSFPPKRTRTVVGRIVKREQAKFKTAFADELIDNR